MFDNHYDSLNFPVKTAKTERAYEYGNMLKKLNAFDNDKHHN